MAGTYGGKKSGKIWREKRAEKNGGKKCAGIFVPALIKIAGNKT
jgi:hypothetical protein